MATPRLLAGRRVEKSHSRRTGGDGECDNDEGRMRRASLICNTNLEVDGPFNHNNGPSISVYA